MNPGGGSGWDEAPLDIQIPDDARELERDVLAYHRELRAQRRRNRLHRLTGRFSGPGTVMPLLASILAVCLVAGAMLSVATFSPAPADHTTRPGTSAPAATHPPAPASTAPASTAPASTASARSSGSAARPSAARGAGSARPSASPRRATGTPAPAGSRLPGLLRPQLANLASPHSAPRVNTGRRDRYDFLPTGSSEPRRP